MLQEWIASISGRQNQRFREEEQIGPKLEETDTVDRGVYAVSMLCHWSVGGIITSEIAFDAYQYRRDFFDILWQRLHQKPSSTH
jgi:hypothetical protein